MDSSPSQGSASCSPTVGCSGRTRARRFSREEIACLRRSLVPLPSNGWGAVENKANVHLGQAADARLGRCEEASPGAPVKKKGVGFHPSRLRESLSQKPSPPTRRCSVLEPLAEPLPQEALTSLILDGIFPRQNKASPDTEVQGKREAEVRKEVSDGSPASPVRSLMLRRCSSTVSIADRLVDVNLLGEFRRQCCESFATVADAFEAFARDVGGTQTLSKKEWRLLLARHGLAFLSSEEHDRLFEKLGFRIDGYVSVNDFQNAVEGSAPVRTLEGLRRRWLAIGYASMVEAINCMDGSGAQRRQRLSLKDFGERLQLAHVHEPEEHSAIFQAVSFDGSTGSIGELAAALATVSPAMLLEDIKSRMVKRYQGNVEKAFFDLDMKHAGKITTADWGFRGVRMLALSDVEARKSFREMDIDGNGELTRGEFLSAIALSEPSLFLDTVRVRTREWFSSIKDNFYETFHSQALDENSLLDRSLFQQLLAPLNLLPSELQTLFELFDTSGDGALSGLEFWKSMRHLCPSLILERVRTRCVQRYQNIPNALLAAGQDLSEPLGFEAFTSCLVTMGVLCLETSSEEGWTEQGLSGRSEALAIFDLLDARHEGVVCLGELQAALLACCASSASRPLDEERDLRAMQDVLSDMAPTRRLVNSLKTEVRQRWDEDTRGNASEPVRLGADGPVWSKHGTSITDSLLGSKGRRLSRVKAFLKEDMPPAGSPPRMTGKHLTRARSQLLQSGAASPAPGDSRWADASEGLPMASGAPSVGEGPLLQKTSSLPAERRCSTRQDCRRPSLKELPPEVTAGFRGGIAKHIDHKGPVVSKVEGVQQSWTAMSESLRAVPGTTQKGEVERYFQTATSTVSRDAALTDVSYSNFAVFASIRSHRKALQSSLYRPRDIN